MYMGMGVLRVKIEHTMGLGARHAELSDALLLAID